MRKILLSFGLAVLAAGPVAASDNTEVMAVLHRFAVGFNKHDFKMAASACADETSIIDDFPPHEWHGPGACAKWASEFDASGVSEAIATLGKPRHLDVTNDRAYVVAPISLTYKLKDKTVRQTGSVWTVALQKGASGWRITGWAWSDGTEVSVSAASGN